MFSVKHARTSIRFFDDVLGFFTPDGYGIRYHISDSLSVAI